MPARERIELVFGLRLLSDVDAMAEDKGIHAREMQQLVAISHDAQLACFSTQIKAPL